MPDKWDQYAAHAAAAAPAGGDKWAQYAAPPVDFTSNPKGEGLYRMLPASNEGFTRSSDEVQVPFSRVKEAENAGFHLHFDEAPRFQKDFAHQGQGPTLLERANQRVQKMLQPVPNEKLGSSPLTNVDRAAGRVLYNTPGYFADVLSAARTSLKSGNTNELLDLIDPSQVPGNLYKQFQSDLAVDPKMAVQNLEGSLVGMGLVGAAAHGGGKALTRGPSVGELRTAAGERMRAPFKSFRPRPVEIAGQKVPVLVGEAAPETRAGRMQTSLKRGGTGAAKFEAVGRAQQAAVKNVIRRVAQQTSGLAGPMAEEPGAAMNDAADATFAKARPMYTALDASLKTVPDALEGVSKVLSDAMGRAKKLGVELGDANVDLSKIRPDKDGSIQWGGSRISKSTHPERWDQLVKEGIIDETGHGTPLSAYMKVRSQLLKMQRSSSDAAVRNAISNEVHAMNDNMETALKGTPLYENWTEANRLWSKGYALRDVADAITKTTKGTPAAQQAPGLSPVQTRIQAPNLVNRLNTLEKDGILNRAFSREESAHLRQAVDILDRARASVGSSTSFLHGYSLRSAMWRGILKLPTLPFVNAMTRLDGLDALKAAEAAKTPEELTRSLAALSAMTVASQVPKNRKEAIGASKANLQ